MESESKISDWILAKYFQNYQVEHIDPFVVIHVSTHWIKNQEKLCVHLKPVATTKKDGALAIMDNVIRLVNSVLEYEIQKPSLLGMFPNSNDIQQD